MKRLYILFLLTIGLIQCSFSQGEFLKRGRSGFGCGFGYSINREANALQGYVGFSYRGFLDAGLAYSKANGGKVKDGIFTPSIVYYFVKQEDAKRAPTLGVSLGFRSYSSRITTRTEVPDTASGWHWYEQTIDRKLNAVIVGVTASRRIGSWRIFFFQPTIGAGASITNSGWEFTLRGGVAIGGRILGGPMLILTPGIERQSELTTFVVTFNAVF